MRIRPPRLQKGDKVAVVAPASPPTKENLEKGIAFLQSLDLEVIVGPSVYKKNHYLAGTDRQRANDLNEMIEDRSIKAIFCACGGYGSARIADKIDYLAFEDNPKIFWGFSDITFLHTAIGQFSNLVTFHGTMLSRIALEETAERSQRMFKQLFAPAEIYYDESISPLHTISGGRSRGMLVGGNLTLIASSIGTKYELDVTNKIVLLEDIGTEPAQIDLLLNQLRQSRKLELAAGFVIGDFSMAEPKNYVDSPSVAQILDYYLGHLGKPVVSGFKMGHENLNVAIPLGVDVILDADQKELAILPGVE